MLRKAPISYEGAKTKSICNCKRCKFNELVIREIIKREKNAHPACESNSEVHTDSSSDVIHSAKTPCERGFGRLLKIDFLKFFISYSITGLSYSENSNGHNSAHIQPIWIKTCRCIACMKGFRMIYFLSRVTGHDPGRN